jgi:hypothetical protein
MVIILLYSLAGKQLLCQNGHHSKTINIIFILSLQQRLLIIWALSQPVQLGSNDFRSPPTLTCAHTHLHTHMYTDGQI